MNHLISIELDSEVAKRIAKQLANMAMPPLDQDDVDRHLLYIAINNALEEDDL